MAPATATAHRAAARAASGKIKSYQREAPGEAQARVVRHRLLEKQKEMARAEQRRTQGAHGGRQHHHRPAAPGVPARRPLVVAPARRIPPPRLSESGAAPAAPRVRSPEARAASPQRSRSSLSRPSLHDPLSGSMVSPLLQPQLRQPGVSPLEVPRRSSDLSATARRLSCGAGRRASESARRPSPPAERGRAQTRRALSPARSPSPARSGQPSAGFRLSGTTPEHARAGPSPPSRPARPSAAHAVPGLPRRPLGGRRSHGTAVQFRSADYPEVPDSARGFRCATKRPVPPPADEVVIMDLLLRSTSCRHHAVHAVVMDDIITPRRSHHRQDTHISRRSRSLEAARRSRSHSPPARTPSAEQDPPAARTSSTQRVSTSHRDPEGGLARGSRSVSHRSLSAPAQPGARGQVPSGSLEPGAGPGQQLLGLLRSEQEQRRGLAAERKEALARLEGRERQDKAAAAAQAQAARIAQITASTAAEAKRIRVRAHSVTTPPEEDCVATPSPDPTRPTRKASQRSRTSGHQPRPVAPVPRLAVSALLPGERLSPKAPKEFGTVRMSARSGFTSLREGGTAHEHSTRDLQGSTRDSPHPQCPAQQEGAADPSAGADVKTHAPQVVVGENGRVSPGCLSNPLEVLAQDPAPSQPAHGRRGRSGPPGQHSASFSAAPGRAGALAAADTSPAAPAAGFFASAERFRRDSPAGSRRPSRSHSPVDRRVALVSPAPVGRRGSPAGSDWDAWGSRLSHSPPPGSVARWRAVSSAGSAAANAYNGRRRLAQRIVSDMRATDLSLQLLQQAAGGDEQLLVPLDGAAADEVYTAFSEDGLGETVRAELVGVQRAVPPHQRVRDFLAAADADAALGRRPRVTFHGVTQEPTPELVAGIVRAGFDPKRCKSAMFGKGAYVAAGGLKARMYALGGKYDRRHGARVERHQRPLIVLACLLAPGDFALGEKGVEHSCVTADSLTQPTQYCIPSGQEHRLLVTHVITLDPDLSSP
eukprot:TRINITY_DN4835_c0_g1_i1.p1 TRINITY_DN4835_c0_g1~~TRINITY_DN4835_c0_g1_i1.p1  ORF type:complete len:1016 (+),score=200.44 TRINITY_DN4835_c0_g1_i1:78-3050(+)